MKQTVPAFVQTYTAASRQLIAYAGTLDPLAPAVAHDSDFLRNDDPNAAFRRNVIDYLFSSTYRYDGLMPAASDELLHELFIADIENSVGHYGGIHFEFALELLRRNLYDTFVHAYTLRLGQDEGMPLEIALWRHMGECGSDAPKRALLLALDARLKTEKEPRARANLEFWRPFLERTGGPGQA